MSVVCFPLGFVGGTTSGTSGTNTAALLHMNGSNGGTTFTDETARQTWSASNATTSTTQKKFGTASLVAGAGAPNYITSSAAVNCGTGDFTFEMFFYPEHAGRFDIWQTPTHQDLYEPGTGFIWNNGDVYGYVVGYSAAPSLNTWHHLAFVKSSGVGTFYLDGVALGAARGGAAQTTSNEIIKIGADPSGGSKIYIDEFRASKIARYTSGFTPTVAEFSVD